MNNDTIDREKVYQVTVNVERFDHGTGEGSLSQRFLIREFFRRTDAKNYAEGLIKENRFRERKIVQHGIPVTVNDGEEFTVNFNNDRQV